VSRLVDKGLLPYDGEELDPAKLESLTDREREVFGEFVRDDSVKAYRDLPAIEFYGLRHAPLKFVRLRAWLSDLWLLAPLFAEKARAKKPGNGSAK
jgi:hypothetical protein